jgi:hypothetical protein
MVDKATNDENKVIVFDSGPSSSKADCLEDV